MTLTLDYDAGDDKLRLHGPGARALLRGEGGTIISVLLNFEADGADELVAPAISNPQQLVADVIQLMEARGYSLVLTNAAKELLRKHIAFMRSFKESSQVGRHLHANPPDELSLPREFTRTLKDFQKLSVAHLIQVPYAANFSVPGSGKTTMVLAAYARLKSEGAVHKLVVICPRSAFDPWEEEYFSCFEREPSVFRISGMPEQRRAGIQQSVRYEMFLTTYQMAVNEQEQIAQLLKRHRCLLVFDEAHHIKKGSGGVWFDAASDLAPLAERRMVLTGTPAPNRLTDIVPQFELLWGASNPAATALDRFGDDLDSIRKTLRPYYSRVSKSDLRLPRQEITKYPVDLGPVQGKIYDSLCQRILPAELPKMKERVLIRDLRKALVVRLLQGASNPTLLGEYSDEFRVPPLSSAGVDLDEMIFGYSDYESPRKMDIAIKLAKKLVDKEHKVLVWSSFIHTAETLGKRLQEDGINTVTVTGRASRDEHAEDNRDALLRRFKTERDTMALTATMPSIAEAVSLHKVCRDAIYVDRSFNCGLYMQSLDRIHRVGLAPHDDVTYHLLVARNTIDEIVHDRLIAKMEVMHEILEDDIGILNLDVPEDLAESDWDDSDIAAVINHIHERRMR